MNKRRATYVSIVESGSLSSSPLPDYGAKFNWRGEVAVIPASISVNIALPPHPEQSTRGKQSSTA
jgi:hypothetical protein